MVRPERRKTKAVKDKNLLKSITSGEQAVQTSEDLHDKGFYIEEEKKEPELNLTDLQLVQARYEKKIQKLEEQIKKSSKGHVSSVPESLKKNEYKLINAIRSEIIAQNKDEPIIGRNLLIKKYKIGPNYLTSSIRTLEERGIIQRTEIPYSATQKTNSWKLLV